MSSRRYVNIALSKNLQDLNDVVSVKKIFRQQYVTSGCFFSPWNYPAFSAPGERKDKLKRSLLGKKNGCIVYPLMNSFQICFIKSVQLFRVEHSGWIPDIWEQGIQGRTKKENKENFIRSSLGFFCTTRRSSTQARKKQPRFQFLYLRLPIKSFVQNIRRNKTASCQKRYYVGRNV